MEPEIHSYLFYYRHKKSVIDHYTREGLQELKEKEVIEMHEYLNFLWRKTDYYNFILNSQLLCIMLDNFIELKDDYKCNRIASLLTKYYPNILESQLEEWIKDEEYEKCEILNNLIEKTKI